MAKLKVREVIIDIGDRNIDEAKKEIIDFSKGIIIICHRCGKIDINPFTHYSVCNPVYEAYRQENIDHWYE